MFMACVCKTFSIHSETKFGYLSEVCGNIYVYVLVHIYDDDGCEATTMAKSDCLTTEGSVDCRGSNKADFRVFCCRHIQFMLSGCVLNIAFGWNSKHVLVLVASAVNTVTQ